MGFCAQTHVSKGPLHCYKPSLATLTYYASFSSSQLEDNHIVQEIFRTSLTAAQVKRDSKR